MPFGNDDRDDDDDDDDNDDDDIVAGTHTHTPLKREKTRQSLVTGWVRSTTGGKIIHFVRDRSEVANFW